MRDLVKTVEAQFDALAAKLDGPIGVAVSGGSDSLALLYLAADWARARQRTLLGLTVDHGLRPAAKAEAEKVGEHCARLGLAHQILSWTPPDGAIGQARARRARHQLLAEALRVAGGTLLLMGHTLDDQCETIAMRAARTGAGEGVAGIRPLAVSPVWPEGRRIFIGRPLLEVNRAGLREMLTARALDWTEDPSNRDRTFERVRVRQDLSATELSALQKQAIIAGAERKKEDGVLADWLRARSVAGADGLIRLEVDELPPMPVLAEGLAWVLMAAAGSDRRADLAGRIALAEDIIAAPRKFRARTLGGAWIAPRRGEIHIARDPGGVTAASQAARPGMIWDGRFYLKSEENGEDGSNLASNLHSGAKECATETPLSPMARATYPAVRGAGITVCALADARLEDIEFMLSYENLMLE